MTATKEPVKGKDKQREVLSRNYDPFKTISASNKEKNIIKLPHKVQEHYILFFSAPQMYITLAIVSCWCWMVPQHC